MMQYILLDVFKMLTKYLLFFFILRICFPGVKELKDLMSYEDPDIINAVEYGMYLFRDLLNPPIIALTGEKLSSNRFELETIHHTHYGSHQILSTDGPTMCLMIRNLLLMMSGTRTILANLFGKSRVSPKLTYQVFNYLVSKISLPTIHLMGEKESGRLSLMLPITMPSLDNIRRSNHFYLNLEFPFISQQVYFHLRNLVLQKLRHSPQLEIEANEMTWLVLWAALENLRMKELGYSMFNLKSRVCLSDDRTFIDKLKMASAEMIWSWATCGSLLSRGIQMFISRNQTIMS